MSPRVQAALAWLLGIALAAAVLWSAAVADAAYDGATGEPPTALARCGSSAEPATPYPEPDPLPEAASSWEQRWLLGSSWASCWTLREAADDLLATQLHDPGGDEPEQGTARILWRLLREQEDQTALLQEIASAVEPVDGPPSPATVSIAGVDPESLGADAEAAIQALNETLWWLAGAVVASLAGWALLRQVMPR